MSKQGESPCDTLSKASWQKTTQEITAGDQQKGYLEIFLTAQYFGGLLSKFENENVAKQLNRKSELNSAEKLKEAEEVKQPAEQKPKKARKMVSETMNKQNES